MGARVCAWSVCGAWLTPARIYCLSMVCLVWASRTHQQNNNNTRHPRESPGTRCAEELPLRPSCLRPYTHSSSHPFSATSLRRRPASYSPLMQLAVWPQRNARGPTGRPRKMICAKQPSFAPITQEQVPKQPYQVLFLSLPILAKISPRSQLGALESRSGGSKQHARCRSLILSCMYRDVLETSTPRTRLELPT